MTFHPEHFAEKYQLALESAVKEKPAGGLNGFELEWNLLDEYLRPLLTVGAGPAQQSFVDYLRAETLLPWLRNFSQLEVFHWMVEFATRPYYDPRGAVYEARLMEAVLINALARAGGQFGERLFFWHGNLLFFTTIGHDSIPGNWGIAKRRYLERCVDLYGNALATAGIHVNLSLPDPLFAWDFMHLSDSERGSRHVDQYKSEFYITATRLLRSFAALFIATSASTPLQAQARDGHPVVILTENDSVRNLTFPNPVEIDRPDLYRSYKDYKNISYDLVQRGVRFGNNNWTPVRARSFAEPVERLISTTGDQLRELYSRGLYSIGENASFEEMARQIEKQNLLARINLPMGRVEIRTDDGCHPLDVDVANLTLKHLLLIRFYGDPEFARSFRYDREDIARARKNEQTAARSGLLAEIENPLTGKPVDMRDFLEWTLGELHPLAAALGLWEELQPLVEMAKGAPNTAEKMRAQLREELGAATEVPLALLRAMAEARETQVCNDVEVITSKANLLGSEAGKITEFLLHAREEARSHLDLPVRFRPSGEPLIEMSYADKTSEILDLAQHLIRIPSVTACPEERLDEVHRAGALIYEYMKQHGAEVRHFDGKYPAIFASFPGSEPGAAVLSGHFDVVEPEPDDGQFNPRVEGDYLWGRGAADMKTVVATYMVWMKDALKSGTRLPPVSLLLVGNEENGEAEEMGTPHVLRILEDESGYRPKLLVAGERTGEKGDELFGEICVENRGVLRFEVIARGAKGHSGLKAAGGDVSDRLQAARASLQQMFSQQLTLQASDGWVSQAKFPFINVGTPGVYNITAAEGRLGVEVRPIPQDHTDDLRDTVQKYCTDNGLDVHFLTVENGVACDRDNPALVALIEAVRRASGSEPKIGRKLAGTSARFAPNGQGVVWGQSGFGPHARDERHYIPSILPYYNALGAWAELLSATA
ncbi:MAG TPA: M20/M25/M40 family metallo-hydrolase [Anaerolineales bacterium]|nr:M20/M25/M40 family metallo-hydrolase [Anaerolineales bacterium]